jgi:hypothetical protein
MESGRAELVIALLPARTDTLWWHTSIMAGEVFFLRGRLKFGDGQTSAPFPSALVGWGMKPAQKEHLSKRLVGAWAVNGGLG